MSAYRTPDIYIEEIPLFPPSIAEVETAIPVFIGHTRFAEYRGESLFKKAVKITSLMEYHERFGQRPPANVDQINIKDNNRVEGVSQRVSYFDW
jgi:phage tail sheath protein FI